MVTRAPATPAPTPAPAETPTEQVIIDEDETVLYAIEHGGDRELLEALRLRVALEIDNPKTSARDLAALSRRLVEINDSLAALTAKENEEGKDDDLPNDEPLNAEDL